MGKHSAARSGPTEIDRLEPSSASIETPSEAARRQRDVRRSPAEMARRRQRTKRVAFGCLGVFVVLLIAGVAAAYAYTAYVNKLVRGSSDKKNPGLSVKLQKEAPRPPGDPFYMAIMGEDKRPGELRARSDTLMIAYVDPPRKHISILSIPRDTRVTIPGHGKQKINSAMQLGGASLVIDTVKELTGIQVNHYMEVDFNGFKDLVDAIGGVTVDVPQKIVDSKAADHNWRAKVIEKGTQKLDGAHALTFVRSRHFTDGDFTRIKDQQLFLKAVAKQTLTLGNVVNVPKIVDAVFGKGTVTTDLQVAQLINLAQDFKGIDQGSISTAMVPGEAKYIGQVSYVITDKPAMQEMVRRMEAGESLEPTVATGTVAAKPAALPANVTITVRNGAGQAGLAAEVSGLLKKDKFRISDTGNTARPVYATTLIVFKSDDAKARLVHDTLGFGTVVKTSSLYSFKSDILVIVGKDWRKEFPKATSAQ
jgi:polyisoprenyl-teichoic acid--peptidoglycan teichoic acid transferase